jgi:hypothetical protein
LAIALAMALAMAMGSLGCAPPPDGLLVAKPARTTVKMDFFHKPLPEIALPNDIATRYDASSPTGRRINASMLAPTQYERRTRELLDEIDGWGVLQPITIPFTGALDIASLIAGHRDADYDLSNDRVYLINIDPDSSDFGRAHHLDMGNGNYPVVLEKRDLYWKNDPRGDSLSLTFEEADEDKNGNGRLDAGEDSDLDGLLDVPNYLPGHQPAADDLAARSDALMTFYERQTHTLIVRPLVPLDERTTYAVVVTRRILDAGGMPVGSPYHYVNHTAQTRALGPLLEVLPEGLESGDIAFAFSFTTQSIEAEWKAVRDGLYGHGPQAHLGADFPAKVASIAPMRDASSFPDMKMPHLLYGETWRPVLEQVASELLGLDEGQLRTTLLEGTGYVDFMVIGSYESPQLFARNDAQGNPLGLNDQSWPKDLDRTPAMARSETVYFTLAVPRKEISVRGEGKPAPVIILGHGYTGNRFDVMEYASWLCRHGFAVLGIDGPSHGISISTVEKTLAKGLLAQHGVGAAGKAVFSDRAFDQNGDGNADSGADFWTAYLFHTRDIVRQFALDYMQLVRVVRSFDGKRVWSFDVDGNGQAELAGDFDADGVIDVGVGSKIYMTGGSLGGIMSLIMGGVEPEIRAIAPISGGGGFSDIGIRSKQGGVYQAFILRSMGPLFVGTLGDDGSLAVETIVTDLNSDATLSLGTVEGAKIGDTMIAINLVNGERVCGLISDAGTVRVGLASDVGDGMRIEWYRGGVVHTGSEHCAIDADATPYAVIDQFAEGLGFQGKTYDAGEPLVVLSQGLGLRRGHPNFRRLQGLGQLVLDPADPAVLAQHMSHRPLAYAGTGTKTGSHALIITTMGDMNVPASSGLTAARAAGILGYLDADPRFGVPANQVLIDNYTAEAVHLFKRYTSPAGDGVHLDIENFSGGADLYGSNVPRAEIPLRIGMQSTDPLGGRSAAIFPYNVPEGQHGFDLPGGMTDRARAQCAAACTEMGDNPCGCATLQTFDIGNFMMNMIGRYFANDGKKLDADLCQSRSDCPGMAPPPPARDAAYLAAR